MFYNRCMGIYKFGNNTYPRRIRRRSNLGHIFREEVRLMGREIWYIRQLVSWGRMADWSTKSKIFLLRELILINALQ